MYLLAMSLHISPIIYIQLSPCLTVCVISFATSILQFNLSVESLKKKSTYSGFLQGLVDSLASTPKHFCSFLVLVSLVIPDVFITCIWQVNLWDWSKGQPLKKEQGAHCLCVGHVQDCGIRTADEDGLKWIGVRVCRRSMNAMTSSPVVLTHGLSSQGGGLSPPRVVLPDVKTANHLLLLKLYFFFFF